MVSKVTWAAVLSSVLALWAVTLLAPAAQAHEVSPSIADLSTGGGQVTVDIRLNLEAFVAGIDLEGLEDTNAADEAGEYDRLRALAPADLAAQFDAYWPRMAIGIELLADGARVPLSVGAVRIPEVGEASLPRPSNVVLSGPLPEGTETLQMGWAAEFGTLVLRQQGPEEPYTGYLEGGEMSEPFAIEGGGADSMWGSFVGYIPVGFDHIVPKGLDHILFVLGLFFLSTHLRPLIWQVSAFTVAHTVTLALGALGIVTVPASVVEPLIAASIVYVAVENVFTSGMNPWRPAIIFCFGLLHGLGFASVLGEFGLPAGQFVAALIGFNIGVEIGQLTVIAAAFLLVGLWFRNAEWYRARIAVPASVVIAAVGAYWFVERVFL